MNMPFQIGHIASIADGLKMVWEFRSSSLFVLFVSDKKNGLRFVVFLWFRLGVQSLGVLR